MLGIHVALVAPELPSCADCIRWSHGKDWRRSMRHGLPLERTRGDAPPCWRCPKSSDGRPNPGAELTGRNARTYELFLMVRAGMPMPNDGIVRRNMALIQAVFDQVARSQSDVGRLLPLLFRSK